MFNDVRGVAIGEVKKDLTRKAFHETIVLLRETVENESETITLLKEEQKMTTEANEKEAAKQARKDRAEAMQAKEDKLNEGRTGKGTRVAVGMSRGKNPVEVVYEAFDESKPDTLPKSLSEFMDLTKVSDEPAIVGFLVDGYNSAQYTAASDPVAEFVNPAWDDDVQKQFRIVVRNYSQATGVSIEDAVALIKPGIEASQKKVA